jgi:predicted DNA-binding transcriptional regulator YafY
MATKSRTRPDSEQKSVTADRAARLYRLVQFLGSGPKTREALRRKLKLDTRGFYRDLEFLRAAGITVNLDRQRYVLHDKLQKALHNLPFPDPNLTLGEVAQLAKGRTRAHRKLKQQLARIIG